MNRYKGIFFIVLFIVISAYAFAQSGKVAKEQSKLQERVNKAVQVTASQIDKEYSANEFSANQKYKGKDIVITGKITSIKGEDGVVEVILEAGDFDWVTVKLQSNQESIASTLSKGKRVKILGIGAGYFMGVDIEDGIIIE